MASKMASVRARVGRELRAYPLGYTALAAFLALGPFAIRLTFPEAPLGLCLVGGFVFGGYCAFCAGPQKFL